MSSISEQSAETAVEFDNPMKIPFGGKVKAQMRESLPDDPADADSPDAEVFAKVLDRQVEHIFIKTIADAESTIREIDRYMQNNMGDLYANKIKSLMNLRERIIREAEYRGYESIHEGDGLESINKPFVEFVASD